MTQVEFADQIKRLSLSLAGLLLLQLLVLNSHVLIALLIVKHESSLAIFDVQNSFVFLQIRIEFR